MLTGIELAGLVLAAFPLIISGLEHYRDGFETIESWWTFRTEFTGFIIDLGTQMAIFDENLELLLSPFVTDEAVFAKLLEHPGGAPWKDPSLEKQLRKRLPKTYDLYMELVGKMYESLTSLQKKLGIENGQLKLSSDTRKGGIKWSYQMKKMKFTFGKKTREKHLQVIESHNKKLKTLLGSSDKLAPYRQKRQSKKTVASYFEQVQAHAVALSAVLRTAWKCNCTAPHIMNLLLEQRISGDTSRETIFNTVFSRLPQRPNFPDAWLPVSIKVTAKQDEGCGDSTLPESSQRSPLPRPSSPRAVQFATDTPRRSTSSRSYRPSSVASAPASSSRFASRRLRSQSSNQTPELVDLQRLRSSSSSTTGDSTSLSRTFSTSSRARSDSLSTAPTSVMSSPSTPPTRDSSSKEQATLTPIIQERTEHVSGAIHDLCETVNQSPTDPAYLGFFGHQDQSFHFHTSKRMSQVPVKGAIVSLADVLSNTPASNQTFSRRDRLQLALTLACSMLQLYTCKWTEEPWSKHDLYFMAESESRPPSAAASAPTASKEAVRELQISPSLRKIYISSSFEAGNDDSTNCKTGDGVPKVAHVAARSALASLGILLLELVFKSPLESHPSYRNYCSGDGQPNDFTEVVTARQWSDDEALGEAGPEFADVVRRCLDCSFGPRPDLRDGAFREAVWQDVVLPLRNMLSVFDGGRVIDVHI